MEFKPFGKINRLSNVEMCITQKIHGTNAQIYITLADVQVNEHTSETEPINSHAVQVDGEFYEIYAGSRSRWLTAGDDNFGFAAFVYVNQVEIIRKLGIGQHFGEWAGIGINSGEGLDKKVFVLFDHWKYPPERELPPQMVAVPVLYRGTFDLNKIEEVMTELKANGSKLVPGFMRPEGIVIDTLGHKLKKVFEAEETKWKGGCDKTKAVKTNLENIALTHYGHLFQPIRMEKLLSRDERYLREYPASLPQLCKDYVEDLIVEGQIPGDEDQVKAVRKAIGSQVFKFAKECVTKQEQL